MDVILLKPVERLGAEGATMQVKPGFARNYLLPRGLAVVASPEQLRQVEARRHVAEQKAKRVREQVEQLKRKLEGKSLTVKLNLGEGDKAFGAITTHDIAQALAQEGLPIEKQSINLAEPIKTLGIYEVPVKLHPEVTATLKLWVVKA
ncbi:MAG: 50S ribosomal protein L9 [Candidatus Omnitrophica bacterium]|nr:50S ribosomal protein L9 [Candidatus Omnitrophota bacterium]